MRASGLCCGFAAILSVSFATSQVFADADQSPSTLPSWRLGQAPGAESSPLHLDASRFASLSEKFVPGQPLPPGMKPPPEYRYTPGDMLPEGYHIEERPRRGFVISGYLTMGIPYGFGLMVGAVKQFENQLGWLAVPVAGPFLTFALRDRACNEIGETAFDSWHCVWDRTSEWFLITDGILQTVGATFLVIGYGSTTPFAVRDDDSAFWLSPTLVGDGGGIGAFGIW
jgi:hypothetical protein